MYRTVWLLIATAAGVQPADSAASDQNPPLPPLLGDQIAFIDEQIRQGWEAYGISPSAEATDGEWCRRVYLVVLGRIPTVEELRLFLNTRSKTKKAQLAQQLLYDQRYTDEYARNWTTLWTNVLIGRSGGTEQNSLINREGLAKYLRESFAQNKPYDRMVYELVTATGVNTAGDPNFNGAVNFLTGKLADSAVQATADTARIFLGLQVQCTQCHNHPFNSWKQNQFWELNAFFRQSVALRRYASGTSDIRMVELANQDFGGEGQPLTPENAELYYELRNGILAAAYPVFVDGKPQEEFQSGYLEDVNRRDELGKLIVQSDEMAKALVNRMWTHFLGYGFTRPIDDMGPHNPPSHPELLSYLAGEFRQHQFDPKQLIGWIVLSQPYGLSSKITASNESDDPALGEPPKFSRFYLRQMRAEELYESLVVATEAPKTSGSTHDPEEARRDWLRQFVIAFGTDEGDETTTFNGTIPQTLMMLNGELVRRATTGEKGGFLSQITSSNMRPPQKIEHLFLAGLARQPTRREIQAANQLLVAYNGDQMAALQDIWWAVLNSNEFILNH